MSILLGIATFVLILTSIFLILLVLAQKAKSDGGMGAAMGGGAAEATFGADTGNVLSKATINAAIVFFVLSFALYLGRIYAGKHSSASGVSLPSIAAPKSSSTALPPLPLTPPASAAPVPVPAQKP
jgi:preprotein translocase subunit SecG